MSEQVSLLAEIEAFQTIHGMADSTFGRRAVNDWKFMKRLRAGSNMTLSTVEKVREFIRSNQDIVGG